MNEPRTINVDRARRYAQRQLEIDRQRRRRRWLDSLTPEHRRIHEGPWAMLCDECQRRAWKRVGDQLAAALGQERS